MPPDTLRHDRGCASLLPLCRDDPAPTTIPYGVTKIRDIFRYGKWGKSLAGVGRWGLLSLSEGAFCAPRGPKSP